MKQGIHRIALIGPESTGKTTLCKLLAVHYNTNWVPEFSREYISALNRPYTMEDIIHCVIQQEKMEDELLLTAKSFLFSDTEEILAKIWMLDVCGKAPDWMEDKIREREYDLYLLTSPDLPNENDPVRENPHRRDFFFNWYKEELDKRKFRYAVITGEGEKRLRLVIEEIEKYRIGII